eukprot:3597952-Amphidinium_carterae.1
MELASQPERSHVAAGVKDAMRRLSRFDQLYVLQKIAFKDFGTWPHRHSSEIQHRKPAPTLPAQNHLLSA